MYIYIYQLVGKYDAILQQKNFKKTETDISKFACQENSSRFRLFFESMGPKILPKTQQRWLPRTLGCYSLLEPLQASQVAFQWTAQLCWGVGSCGDTRWLEGFLNLYRIKDFCDLSRMYHPNFTNSIYTFNQVDFRVASWKSDQLKMPFSLSKFVSFTALKTLMIGIRNLNNY